MPRLLDTRVVGQDLADVASRNYGGSQPGWALRVNTSGKSLELGPPYATPIVSGPFTSDVPLYLSQNYATLTMPNGDVVTLAIVTTTGSAPPSVAGGQIAFTIPGEHTWTVPTGVTSICAVAVGGGGGGGTSRAGASGGNGGDLRWINNFTVVPGEVVTIMVGAGGTGGKSGSHNSSVGKQGGESKLTYDGTDFLIAAGGNGGLNSWRSPTANSGSTTIAGDVGGGDGGIGGPDLSGHKTDSGGGGGAGGYMGPGGNGGIGDSSPPVPGVAGFDGQLGGGGGGAGSDTDPNVSWGSAGGGGVGLKGQGASGKGGTVDGSQIQCSGGQGGSGGTRGGAATAKLTPGAGHGGLFGGGGGGSGKQTNKVFHEGAPGGNGAVRIVWGTGRSFPTTNVDDLVGMTPSYILATDAPCYYGGVVVNTEAPFVLNVPS